MSRHSQSRARELPFATTTYRADHDGVLRALLPSRCVFATGTQTCCIFLDHYRSRKTGPGHPVRLEMVHRLRQNGCCCCGELCNCFSQSQSTISQHLSVLADAGIVDRRSEGNRSVYSLNAEALQRVEKEIAAFLSADHQGTGND